MWIFVVLIILIASIDAARDEYKRWCNDNGCR